MSNNHWCATHDGKEINLFDLDLALVTVDRIAQALARINRFAGHWVFPISVARHSIRVAELLRRDGCDTETQLQGLFHDASEVFTTDIPSPLKRLLFIETSTLGTCVAYSEFEDRLLQRIFIALEIAWPMRPEIHTTDKSLTNQECSWVRGKDHDLYRGRSTDLDVVALAFRQHATALFNERACANGLPIARGDVADLLGGAHK